ncbi:MAG TPA: Gfo/Idh/MocA family oxidoreductase [Gemmatimonadales bacterium]|nr:Gfo/Idh/MocA family oxidoreductase [Gemmatimonadales bacterium]
MSADPSRPSLTRRDLLRTASAASAALAFPGMASAAETAIAPPRAAGTTSMMGVPFDRHDTVRIGMVGTGLRGSSVLGEFLSLDNVRVTALCDIVPEKIQRNAKRITDAGHAAPALYSNGDHDFEHLVQRDDVDFVYTATPWPFHTPVCLAALKAGKHCGTEVPAAMTLEQGWDLVNASEKARRHCMIMENCCYDFNEMLVNTMVKKGLFGEILYAEGAYLHDLRSILFEDRDEGLWRRLQHTRRQGNFYPTHGLGPVAWYLDIHRGDRFDYLVSMSTAERGLSQWREAHVPKDSPKWSEKYIEGDLNTSLIKTARGKTILLEHGVSLPTPYDRLNSIRGTKGVFKDYPGRVYLDGQRGGESFKPVEDFKNDYTHLLWQQLGERARKTGGEGGMDFIMAYRLIQCMHDGLPPDIDVYDAAAWSAPWPLSETSLTHGSTPVKFPDFSRGTWSTPRQGL